MVPFLLLLGLHLSNSQLPQMLHQKRPHLHWLYLVWSQQLRESYRFQGSHRQQHVFLVDESDCYFLRPDTLQNLSVIVVQSLFQLLVISNELLDLHSQLHMPLDYIVDLIC